MSKFTWEEVESLQPIRYSAKSGNFSRTVFLRTFLRRWTTNCNRASKVIGISNVIALCTLLLIPIAAVGQVNKESVGAVGVLRSLGARKMGTEEYNRRVHDDIGAIFSLRLRFEAPEDHGVYVYAPNGGVPFGYSLERKGDNIRWVTGNSALNGPESPGFLNLRNQFGKGWLFLPARSALEWEVVVDRTNTGHEDARSIFVKQREDESPREVISTWFATPVDDSSGSRQ